jgi:hypothetical protein
MDEKKTLDRESILYVDAVSIISNAIEEMAHPSLKLEDIRGNAAAIISRLAISGILLERYVADDSPKPNPYIAKKWYKPLENPRRYPLELALEHGHLHVNLWSANNSCKWTIGRFVKDQEGYDFQFIADRPFHDRVNWEHFREVVEQGQAIADKMFDSE